MYDSDAQQYEVKLRVELELADGTAMLGDLFVSPHQRLQDLLNDERSFVPFETSEGVVTVLRKSAILRATPLNEAVSRAADSNPYHILGVEETASDEELREAYHRCGRENHPDRLAAMGLPPEFLELANEKMARINDAYWRIRRRRGLGKGPNGARA